jgi:hypothetical protein
MTHDIDVAGPVLGDRVAAATTGPSRTCSLEPGGLVRHDLAMAL